MYFKKFLLILLCSVGLIVTMSCKSSSDKGTKNKKNPKTSADKKVDTGSDTGSSDTGSDTGSDTLNLNTYYYRVYIVFSSTGANSTPVVCRANCGSYIPALSTVKDKCESDKTTTFITKKEFDADGSIKKFLENYQTEIDGQGLAVFDSLYKQAEEIAADGSIDDPLGKYSVVCDLSKVSSIHAVTFNSSYSSSTWVGYTDSNTQANATSSGVKMWKDLDTQYFWTLYSPYEKKTLSDAVTYCNDLSYGGLNDWVLPTYSDMVTNGMSSVYVTKPSVGWWTGSKYSDTKYYYRYRANSSYGSNYWWNFDSDESSKEKYVLCINKTGK